MSELKTCGQWRNRQGAECPPETSDWEISADLLGKKEAREKGKEKWVKIEKKRRKIVKGKVEKLQQNKERYFFFCFSLFKTTKICFEWSVPKGKFSTKKKHFTLGKKSGKMTLPPQKNFGITPLPAGQPETWTFPGSDRNQSGIREHFNEYFWVGSSRGISFQVSPGWDIIYQGMRHFSRDLGINVHLNS